jgi:ElaB/YqjD/DUF883 family membrane-anchored ribosome-binding protein
MFEDTNVDTHPSYGLLQFNRVQGSPKNLFGTHLKPQHFIELKVLRGERHAGLGSEHYYGKEVLLRAWMSANQFAECITTMNIGMGIPCTLRQVKGEGELPYPPEQTVRTEEMHAHFKKRISGFSSSLKESVKQVEAILNKTGSITKGDRQQLHDIMCSALQEVDSNIPYILEEYEEATQKLVVQAKTEFDSFVTHAATRIGLEQISKNGLANMQLLEDNYTEK